MLCLVISYSLSVRVGLQPFESRSQLVITLREYLEAVPQLEEMAGDEAVHVEAPEATDDAALLEALGLKVAVVGGEYHNLKLTSPEDLAIAERWSAR